MRIRSRSMKDEFINLIQDQQEQPGKGMKKEKVNTIEVMDSITNGVVSESVSSTSFSETGISLRETQRISFSSDGMPTNPEFHLARCSKGHLVSKSKITLCTKCGTPTCPIDRRIIDNKHYCKRCGIRTSVYSYIKQLFLVPFKD